MPKHHGLGKIGKHVAKRAEGYMRQNLFYSFIYARQLFLLTQNNFAAVRPHPIILQGVKQYGSLAIDLCGHWQRPLLERASDAAIALPTCSEPHCCEAEHGTIAASYVVLAHHHAQFATTGFFSHAGILDFAAME